MAEEVGVGNDVENDECGAARRTSSGLLLVGGGGGGVWGGRGPGTPKPKGDITP